MIAAPKRAVYICPYSPIPRHFGGAIRIDAVWRALSAVADVHLVVFGDRPPARARRELLRRGAVIYPPRFETPTRRAVRLLRALAAGECIPAARYLSPRRIDKLVRHLRAIAPDVIVVGDEYLSVLIPALRSLGARVVLDTHNAASRAHARIAASARSFATRLAYGVLARNTAMVEHRFFPLADEIWAVSSDDAAFYAPLSRRPVRIVPNVIDVPDCAAPDGASGTVVFAASFSYWPNEDAALRLLSMTRSLRKAGSLRTLQLVGISPSERLLRASAAEPWVVVTGRVPQVDPYVANASVVAIPLAAGSGTKLKVLEAMAAGKPVVTTPIGAEGLDIVPGVHAEVVELGHFEAALDALLRDPGRRAALGRNGRALVEERFSQAAMDAAVQSSLLQMTESDQPRPKKDD